jgi:HAD superfamily hydrolase (TIGR01549 family)
MRLFLRPPLRRHGILAFDLDGTLYDNAAYIRFQEESQVRRLADFLGLSYDEAGARIRRIRQHRKEGGLPPTSLANIFRELGVPFDLIIRWRQEEFHPSEWLSEDTALIRSLSSLKNTYVLGIITNNPHSVAEESLKALGIQGLFNIIIALDDTWKSKPDPAPFKALVKKTGTEPKDCIVVGDRYDIDIEPALAQGMNGILIESAQELYALPQIVLP